MLLPPEETTLFLSLYQSLIGFAAVRLGKVAGIADTKTFKSASNEARAEARDQLLDNISLTKAFVKENPDGFREQELFHVTKWEYFVRGDFFIERDLKNHTVFLDDETPPKAYGVLGLSNEIVDMIPYPLPTLVSAVLLPWKGQIIWDGLISIYNISFGGGIKQGLRESYRQAKAQGIIISLEPGWQPELPKPRVKPKIPAIKRFLQKKCPKKVVEFQAKYGPPRREMTVEADQEYSLWDVDRLQALDVDYLMVYPNIIKNQVLYVYAKNGNIRHIGVVERTEWRKGDSKPHNGQKLMC